MRHFVIELYRLEKEGGWKAVCMGEEQKHTIFAEPMQVHSYAFNNGFVHVHVYDATMDRRTARAWVEAWFKGYFKTVFVNSNLNFSEKAKKPDELHGWNAPTDYRTP